MEGLYYQCSENKGADQLHSAQLICVFVFAYAKSQFSHDAAHIILRILIQNVLSKFFKLLALIAGPFE